MIARALQLLADGVSWTSSAAPAPFLTAREAAAVSNAGAWVNELAFGDAARPYELHFLKGLVFMHQDKDCAESLAACLACLDDEAAILCSRTERADDDGERAASAPSAP